MKGKKNIAIISLIIFVSIWFWGCSSEDVGGMQEVEEEKASQAEHQIEKTDTKEPIKVTVSFYPYYDFSKAIGGENITVKQMVPDGADPHSYEPSPRDLIELEGSDVFIFNGFDMEPWIADVLELIKGKDIVVVKASELIEGREYDHDHDHDHSHDHNHDHDHGEFDPHIWTDPMNVIKIAEEIKEIFAQIDPDRHHEYALNFKDFEAKLLNLNHEFESIMEEAHTNIILVSHSAFGYLADRHGIKEIAVTGITPHAEPNPGRLAELTKLARENELKYIFFESLANPRTAEVLAEEAGLKPLMLYNLEGLTADQKEAEEDYISLMEKNVEAIRKALTE
ncbi:metal ABC transporter solute-binding protein, Zn/Mn family [Tindallia californiensis]|uniref:Zinc transport system substrate-binding protein n=1 Tax=Tindallia californiensis TaxID=159292 RepID=A0A1H3J7Q5_9FIRM|nr:zinc ABC transporter substrate-binding protein [Tindallia californiensis]SDY35204.1 zinc transport system substrate-binding protein [Tindallia californiensis]